MIKKIFFFIIILIILYDLFFNNKISNNLSNNLVLNSNVTNKIKNMIPDIISTSNDISNYTSNDTLTDISNDSTNYISNDSTNYISNDSTNYISNDSTNYTSENSYTSIENIIPDIINQSIESSNQSIESSNQSIESSNQNIESSIDINMYGKPYEYAVNKFIHWEFYDPKPWTKIIYNYGDEYPFYFYIKARIPSLNDYQNWKNIMHNLNFDPRSGELIIPSTDEETALSISNLIISNLKGDITLEEIINKDLIAISVLKCRKYEVVKHKIREQLIQNITHSKLDLSKTSKPIEIIHNKKNNNLDDIRTNNYFYYNQEKNVEISDFGAYDGNEFSFV